MVNTPKAEPRPRLRRHEEKPIQRNARAGDVIAVSTGLGTVNGDALCDHYIVTGTPRGLGVTVLPLNRDLTEVTDGLTAFSYEQLEDRGAGYVRLSGYCAAKIAISLIEKDCLFGGRTAEALLRLAAHAGAFDNATEYRFFR
jgi:hypothetical protein